MKSNNNQKVARQSGFLLLETLITIAILAVGLLGVSAMLSVSLKSGQAAIERGEISIAMASMAGRMRANTPESIVDHFYDVVDQPLPSNMATCKSASPSTAAAVALNDICDFMRDIETTLGRNQQPTATIACSGARVCNYAISWHDNGSKSSLEYDYDANNTAIDRTYTYNTTVMF